MLKTELPAFVNNEHDWLQFCSSAPSEQVPVFKRLKERGDAEAVV